MSKVLTPVVVDKIVKKDGHIVTVLQMMEVEKNKYKFRAECQPDIDALFELIPSENIVTWTVSPEFSAQYPDRVCEIELSGMMLEDLKRLMRKIPDGHVMLETVAELKNYTGER